MTVIDANKALLVGLREITPQDQTLFNEAVAAANVTGWTYFFPYLQLHGSASPKERLLFEEADGSILLYRHKRRNGWPILSLLAPPFPWSEALMKRGMERSAAFNADGRGRIARVSEDQLAEVARLGYDIRHNMDEYIYDPALVLEASGKGFTTLRRKLAKLKRPEISLHPYSPKDAEACEALLDSWLETMGNRNVQIGPYRRYARKALHASEDFGDQLKGEIIVIDDKIAAFSFAGWTDETNGCLFITVSDHTYPGLAYLQRYSIMGQFDGITQFNDGTDAGRDGMKQMKRAFRPVRIHAVYSARTQRR